MCLCAVTALICCRGRGSGSVHTSSDGVSTTTYQNILGTVESVDDHSSSITISHGDIPGFMSAMTMDYPVKDKSLISEIKQGDKINFTIEDKAGIATITELHKQ